MKLIRFKSLPEYWNKERIGLKKNTLRKVDMGENKFKMLEEWEKIMKDGHFIFFIEITNTETKESFRKRITDITFYKGWVIISWI